MKYEVSTTASTAAAPLVVEGNNWKAALKAALSLRGEPPHVHSIACEIREDQSIHVTDAFSRVFVLKKVPADTALSPPPTSSTPEAKRTVLNMDAALLPPSGMGETAPYLRDQPPKNTGPIDMSTFEVEVSQRLPRLERTPDIVGLPLVEGALSQDAPKHTVFDQEPLTPLSGGTAPFRKQPDPEPESPSFDIKAAEDNLPDPGPLSEEDIALGWDEPLSLPPEASFPSIPSLDPPSKPQNKELLGTALLPLAGVQGQDPLSHGPAPMIPEEATHPVFEGLDELPPLEPVAIASQDTEFDALSIDLPAENADTSSTLALETISTDQLLPELSELDFVEEPDKPEPSSDEEELLLVEALPVAQEEEEDPELVLEPGLMPVARIPQSTDDQRQKRAEKIPMLSTEPEKDPFEEEEKEEPEDPQNPEKDASPPSSSQYKTMIGAMPAVQFGKARIAPKARNRAINFRKIAEEHPPSISPEEDNSPLPKATPRPTVRIQQIDISKQVHDDALEDIFLEIGEIFEMSKQEAIEFSLDMAIEKIPSESGAVFLSPHNRELRFAAARGPKSNVVQGKTIPMGVGFAGISAQKGSCLLITDASKDPRFHKDISEDAGYEVQHVLCVPIQSSSQIYGCIELINPTDRSVFSHKQLNALKYIGEQLGEMILEVNLQE